MRSILISDKSHLFINILILSLINLSKEIILNDLKSNSIETCAEKVPNSDCFVRYFDQNYGSNDLIYYSIDCKNIESHKQFYFTIDFINKNNQTICKNKSNAVLKEVNFEKSDSSAVIKSIGYLDNSVESLSISESLLTQIPNKLFETLIQLKHLNLSNNNLTEFHSNLLFSSNNRLVSLDLSQNQLISIDFKNLKFLESLFLSNNSLKSIEEFGHKFKSISLANNEWNCDNHLVWLLEYTTNGANNVLNRDKIRCKSPESAEGMTFGQRLSVLKSPICSQCECSLLIKQDIITINCSGKELTDFPSHLPSITKIVRLDNNKIKSIPLNGLSDWRNVSYLHLNNNSIETFDGLDRHLKSLVALNLTQNRLKEIPFHLLSQLEGLDELYLSDNPWRCDCKTVKFQGWLESHFKSVKDIYNIRCGGSDPSSSSEQTNGLHSGDSNNMFSNRILLRIAASELCHTAQESIDIYPIINCLLTTLIIIIIIKLIYDYFWQKRTGKLPKFFKINI